MYGYDSHWFGICCANDISLNIYVMLLPISSPHSNIISFLNFSLSAAYFLFNFLSLFQQDLLLSQMFNRTNWSVGRMMD